MKMKTAGALACALLSASVLAAAAADATVKGTVKDATGAVVPGATVEVQRADRQVLAVATTDAQGAFSVAVPAGRHVLAVAAPGFASQRRLVRAVVEAPADVEVSLQPGGFEDAVTVTATPGVAQNVDDSPQPVNVLDKEVLDQRAKSAVAQIANEEPGLHLQRTSPTIQGIYVRGLTGNKVNVFVDGVRFSTGAMRGGITTFMGLNDPSNLEVVEVLRGPSAQYGSDAIGGSVQYLTRTLAPTGSGRRSDGSFSLHANSADASFGSDLRYGWASPRFALQGTLEGRRVNTLRPGDGIDTHNAVTRFLGLPSTVIIGDRLPDTAFTQYGGNLRATWALSDRDELTGSYLRTQQDGGKRYDQLLGGDGNLVADLRNLMLDFGYLRYTRRQAGPFDSLSLGYSFNAQREERVNQGGNGNPRASITHEYEKTRAHGVQAQAVRAAGKHGLSLGADVYFEEVTAPSFSFNPVTSASTVRRGRVPDGATYVQGGVYAQDVVQLADKFTFTGSARYNFVSYESKASNSPLVNNAALWPDDSLDVDRLTFRAGLSYAATPSLTLTASAATGFRAPHITDLGTLGLTGAGYEVSFDAVSALNATVGDSAAASAASSGQAVEQQLPEKSRLFDGSIRWHGRRVETDFYAFVNDIDDNVTKQALILPPGAVGTLLGDQRITTQNANGAVFVAASTSPVLVRANFDDARIWGLEHTLNVKLSDDFRFGTVGTYLHSEDKRTGHAPNIEGGRPAPELWLKLRWAPAGKRFWAEPYARLVQENDRLSTLDLEDRRGGATRTRNSISNFFNNGARARGLVDSGADGVAGNADDILIPTGETLAQVQTRVLGSAGSSPLYPTLPGYALFGLRGGLRLGTRHDLFVDFENIGDKSYHGVNWGVDGPGRGLYVRYRMTF